MALRKPNKKELKIIKNALKYFGSENSFDEIAILLMDSGGKKEAFALSKDLAEFLDSLGIIGRIEGSRIYHAGIKIGEVGRRLRLSLEGTFWIARNDRKKVWVNDKGEMLFLYGRDLFSSSILQTSDFEENEIVLVANRYGDIIGIGKSRFPSDKIKEVEPDRVVIENLVDRGEYLRHGRLYDSF